MTSLPPESRFDICYELRIAIKDEHKDALISLLADLGEDTFVEGALDCDVEFDYDYEHLTRDYYSELAHNAPLILYSEDLARLENVKTQVLAQASQYNFELAANALNLAPLADQNWRDSWKASFKPVDVNGVFVILPPWENPLDFPQKHKIIIDPGMAFGTGQHETTRLCLELFLKFAPVQSVFDVGTGSGILAIAASMLGATEILGNDIDPESVAIATENAVKNGISNARFTETSVDAIEQTEFDLIFANIQVKPLLRIFPDILKRVKARGHIIISGILASEIDEFTSYLDSCGAKVIELKQMGHWMGILCERGSGTKPAT